jgi:hypothetical protein
VQLNIQFRNEPQRQYYFSTARNQVFSGGFNNGKTFIGCFKQQTLLFTFPNYRTFIARQKYTDLRKTTMQTFFSICPSELIESHNEQEGVTLFKNGSLNYWLHADNIDSSTARGLEVNSGLIDQAEETEEKVFDVLDARIGRWSGAIVPDNLMQAFGDAWQISPLGKPVAPSYFGLLSNPDTQFHYIYRMFHPDSAERRSGYFYVEGEWDPDLGSYESYEQALKHDPEWVDKYVRGKWGLSSAAIHFVPPACLLDASDELTEKIREKSAMYRAMDHGDSAPTCCLWFAAVDGVYICYREYYVPNKTISYHRRAIHDLSGPEEYGGSYADPQIFKKTAQRDGGFWSVADEYRSRDLDGPPVFWNPADNNEFATRNRINELLRPSDRYRHPVTKESPAPGIYFIKRSASNPQGCLESYKQLGMQRRKLLGTIDGKSVYSDDRDESITDHAYDCVRYFTAMHGAAPQRAQRRPPKNSFAYFNALLNRGKHKGNEAASVS